MDPPSYLFSLFKKRRLDDVRADYLSTHINLNLLAHARVFDRNVRETDVLFQKRSRTAGRYLSYSLPVNEHVLMIAGDATFSHFKTDQFAFDAFLLLPREGFATNEVVLIEFANPTEIRFEQGGG